MGLLMTPRLGPRVRIAVVTTDALLPVDERRPDPTAIEFCRVCKKCVACCPAGAIPDGDRREVDGVMKWAIDPDACYRYWCVCGTDCGRCLAVCPYSHPDNLLHNGIRRLIRRSFFAARLAARADDFLYGKKPKPKPEPAWMKTSSNK
jgi:epoxyqueuosine reductase QueG